MVMSADQWEQWGTTKLPEQYRETPDEFLSTYEKTVRDAEEARKYKDWYENSYKPWEETNRDDLAAYQRWKASQGKDPKSTPAQPDHGRSPSIPEVDWDDPDSVKQGFGAIASKIAEMEGRLANESTAIRTEFATGRDNVMQLISLLKQADTIEREDLYSHLGYKPQRDIGEVVKFAAEKGLTDLSLAAGQRYAQQTTQQQIAAAIKAEREKWEQEQRNQQIATERGGRGTPRGMTFRGERRPADTERPARSGLRRQRDYNGLYEAIAAKNPDIEWAS